MKLLESKLSYGRQYIDESDIDSVVDALKSPILTGGPLVDEFEGALASYLGTSNAVCCSNGTAALHLAYAALGVGQGSNDVVIVPAMTFAATANAAAMLGAKIVFSDVSPETGLMELGHLRAAYDEALAAGNPVAVAVVHLNGQAAPMAEMAAFARSKNMKIVEDACHALGSYYAGPSSQTRVGNCRYADACCFSFHPVKTIATGEGGAITFADTGLSERARLLRSHGISRDPETFENDALSKDSSGHVNRWYYDMQELGFNYRLTDIQCALGISQLKKLDKFVEKRALLRAIYEKKISVFDPVVKTVPSLPDRRTAWHLLPVLIDFDKTPVCRNELVGKLASQGVGTQVHYIPVPWLSYWRKRAPLSEHPGAASYYHCVLSLPLYYDLSEDEVEFVVGNLADILKLN